MLLAVDPGLVKMGFALFNSHTRRLVSCGLLRRRSRLFSRGAAAWIDIVDRLPREDVAEVIVETMQVDRRTRGKAADLLEVQAVAACVLARFHWRGAHVVGVIPRAWKGSAPKSVTRARVEATLSPEELELIPHDATDDVFDAIGLGLYYWSTI